MKHFVNKTLTYSISLLSLLLCLFNTLIAQEWSVYQNYSSNSFYNINPAAAGFDGAFISQLSASKQWLGITGSPAAQVFSNSVRLGDEDFFDPSLLINRPFFNVAPRVGLGLTIFNESSGPLRHTGMMFAYAYHIKMRNNRLSFGLSGIVTQYHLNVNEFNPVSSNDPSLYTNASSIIPDVNLGAMFYNSKLFIGASANGLINVNNIIDHTKSFPDIVVCSGYKYSVNSIYKLEPSIFIFRYGQGSISADLNGKLFYRDKNWLLLSYHTNGEVSAGFGVTIKTGIQLNYIYGVNTTGLATYNQGSQSIALRADIVALVRKRNK